jgi:hypothetical protein
MLATFANGRRSGADANRAAERAGGAASDGPAAVMVRPAAEPGGLDARRGSVDYKIATERKWVAEVIKAIQRIDRRAMHHGRNRLGAFGVWLLASSSLPPSHSQGLPLSGVSRVRGG